MSLNLKPAIISPSAPHSHTVIFLHGRGDTTPSLASSLTLSRTSSGLSLFALFPSFKWVFPQAPTRRCANHPATWPQWFDVWDARDFSFREEETSAPGLREVVPAIRELVAEEAGKLGGGLGEGETGWGRVVLAGISMGAATGVHTLFNLGVPGGRGLAGFMGFSGRCPFMGRSLEGMREILALGDVPADDGAVVRKTPMLLEHCVDDPLVLIDRGRGLRDVLRDFGANVEWREYPDGGHWFNSPAGMDDAVRFLNEHVLGKDVGEEPTLSQSRVEDSDAMDLV